MTAPRAVLDGLAFPEDLRWRDDTIAADRDPPRASTVFAVDRSAPGALIAVEVDRTTTPAETLELGGGR